MQRSEGRECSLREACARSKMNAVHTVRVSVFRTEVLLINRRRRRRRRGGALTQALALQLKLPLALALSLSWRVLGQGASAIKKSAKRIEPTLEEQEPARRNEQGQLRSKNAKQTNSHPRGKARAFEAVLQPARANEDVRVCEGSATEKKKKKMTQIPKVREQRRKTHTPSKAPEFSRHTIRVVIAFARHIDLAEAVRVGHFSLALPLCKEPERRDKSAKRRSHIAT